MGIKHDWQSLLNEYQVVQSQMSAYQFCRLKKINNASFYKFAKEANVEIRQSVYQNNSAINISTQELSKLEGHLLGDGSIFYADKRKKNPVFCLTSKYQEYLHWESKNSQIIVDRPIWNRVQYDSRTNKTYTGYWIRSRSSEFLKEQHQRWYPNGIKLVPRDLTISKEMLLRWYIDDGCLHNGSIFLSTDWYTKEDVEFLQSILLNAGFSTRPVKNGKGYRLYILKIHHKDFFEYIGQCPVNCFRYKWSVKG